MDLPLNWKPRAGIISNYIRQPKRMSYLTHGEKLSILSRLIELAQADEVVNMAEISYIFWTAQQSDVSPLELKNLFEKPARISNPMTLRDRLTLFYCCLVIMYIDTEIHPLELAKCKQIAADMRLPERQTEQLLTEASQQNSELISLDQLLKLYGITY